MDGLASNGELLHHFQEIYKHWLQQKHDLELLVQQKENFQKEADYQQYIFNEFEQLNLENNELENLETELKLLSNSEGIKTALTKVYFDLKEQEQPIVQQLKVLQNQLLPYAEYHTLLPEIITRIQSAQIELQDIADEINNLNNEINFDQQRIDTVNERLSSGYKLLKKHGVKTTNDLLAIKNEIALRLDAVLNIDESISIVSTSSSRKYGSEECN